MEDAESIAVCIDNSAEAYRRGTYELQIEALRHYCKTKLDVNPETKVTVFSMGSRDFRMMWGFATSDFKIIDDYVQRIIPNAGDLWFKATLSLAPLMAFTGLCSTPPNMPKRMLLLVGGLVDTNYIEAEKYGSKLKALGIAVDVVSFYLREQIVFTPVSNQYGRMELDTFVDAANSNGNSHIKHVKPEHVKHGSSSIRRVLSKYILRKTPRLPRKINHHKKAKGKNHAAGDNKHVRSQGVKLGKRKAVYALENEGVKLCRWGPCCICT